ncbi:glycosyltransferase-like protein LARGE [Paragonimus westermani]|uniref:Glycosyltransferase-like protein LARGE n=1 Tax=Paragonimus westermani TaxID=34504 RepID=A0A5J4NB51_9TREM|nr:glycosyltransferase-like protein LARGE [Paragonimus westermani]
MQPSRSISSTKLHSVKNKPIHVMTIMRGLKVINRTLVMLKSMLYYEGRLQKSRIKCNLNTTLLLQCQEDLQSTSNRIDLHFLVDDEAGGAIQRLISHWRLDNVNVRTYRMDKYLEQFRHVPNRHVAGVTPLLKLVTPTILPVGVEKVIFIDTDTLFHANVKQLWTYFDQFDDEQCPGINTGVMLLHLKKLRGYAWDSMWRQVIEQETSGGRFLRVGEQVTLLSGIPLVEFFKSTVGVSTNTQRYFSEHGMGAEG